jgi:hypothetical protein
MDKNESHLQNVINRKSKDYELGAAILYFKSILESLNIQYIVMGSSALQTYYDYFHRLPNDFDITLPEQDILKVKEFCDSDKFLRFEFNEVASKVYYQDYFYLHLIPGKMNIIDKVENVIFQRININHLDKTEIRKINFINFQKEIFVPVPILEYSFCLNLFVPLDSNAFSDNISILEKYTLNVELIEEFMYRVPEMTKILAIRFSELREKISLFRPDLLSKLPRLSTLL